MRNRQNVIWNGFGSATMNNDPVSAKEAIEKCKANFDVALQPVLSVTPELMDMIHNGDFINAAMLEKMIVNGRKATMRMDTMDTLGIVSDSYGIVQYQQAFDFVDMLTTGELGSDKAKITTCATLGGGRRCFMVAEFPEPIVINAKRDDTVKMYIVMSTSHDGSGGVRVCCTPIRVICQNMLNLAFRECVGKISLKHSRFVGTRLDLTNSDNASMAYKTLGLYENYKKTFEAKLAQLSAIKLTQKESEDILAKAILAPDAYKIYKADGLNSEDISTRSKNTMFGLMDALENGIGQKELESGTGLWLVNGLTTYYQNDVAWKNNEKKFDSITEGSVSDKLNTVYQLLVA